MKKKMKKGMSVSIIAAVGCAMLATSAFFPTPENASAAGNEIPDCTGASASPDLTGDLLPLYQGTFYSATRGGHMVFTNITIDPNRDMVSGSIAGRMPLPNNEQADAIQMSADEKYIFYPTWDESMLYTIDIQDRLHPKVVAETEIFDEPTKFCGSQIAADGRMYLSSMSLGDVHKIDISNPLKPKLMDRNYKSTYLCNVQKLDDKRIITTDMKEHKLFLYDVESGKRLKEMKPGGDEYLHRGQLSADGKTLWQASTGSLGSGKHSGRVYEIDTDTFQVKNTIVVGENYDGHDAITTPDGKYLIGAFRRTPGSTFRDSEYVVINLEKKKVIGTVSMCIGCHNANDVVPELSKGREVYICGIQAAWKKK